MLTDSDLQKTQRVAQASRKRLLLFSRRPQPPRGVLFNSSGYVAWEEPQELRNVTHYNVYAGDETTLYRRYPVGTVLMNDLTPDKTLIWVSSYNEESGQESVKIKAAATASTAAIIGAFDPATPAPNVSGLTATNERTTADQNGEMVRIKGTFTLPTDVTNYTGALVVAQASGDPSWTILATLGAADVSYIGPWMPSPRANTSWTVKVQSYNGAGLLNPRDGSTPTASTTILGGVAGYDMKKVLAGTYDNVDFGFDFFGNFKVLNVDLRKAFSFNASEFETVSGTTFRVKALTADKINAGTLKVGGVSGMAGQVAVVDSDNVTLIGWVGYDGSSYRGGWFKNLWVGGTNPSDAPIRVTGTTANLQGVDIKVGPGATGANGQFWVYNSSTILGWIGTNGGFNGAWFSNLWIGGSGPGSANIAASGGSVTLTNTPVTITSGNFRIDLNTVAGAYWGSSRGLTVRSYNAGGSSYTFPDVVSEVSDDGIYVDGAMGSAPGTGVYPGIRLYNSGFNNYLELYGKVSSPVLLASLEALSFLGGKLHLGNGSTETVTLDGAGGHVYFSGNFCTSNSSVGGLAYGAAPTRKIPVYSSIGGTFLGYIPII